MAEAAAKMKISNPNAPLHPFQFENLPTSSNDTAWNEIRTTYGLSLEELSALKNARCFRGGGCANDFEYPFFYKRLSEIGLSTPLEQYILYGTVGTALYASLEPLRKGYYLNKWLNESDEVLKTIWAGKGKLLNAELQAGKAYLPFLRQTPRRWAMLPVTFLFIEGARFGYKRLFGHGK